MVGVTGTWSITSTWAELVLWALEVGQGLGASGSRVGEPEAFYFSSRGSLQAQVEELGVSSDHIQGPKMMATMAGLCRQQVLK